MGDELRLEPQTSHHIHKINLFVLYLKDKDSRHLPFKYKPNRHL